MLKISLILFFSITQAKQEGWWLYVSDKKQHMLITAPVLTLKESEEVSASIKSLFFLSSKV